MKHYALYNSVGEIVTVGTAPEAWLAAYFAQQTGLTGISFDAPVDPELNWIDPTTQDVMTYSVAERAARNARRGDSEFAWNPATGAYVDNRAIESVRADVRRRLKDKREALLQGGFDWDGSTFDSDAAISQPRLLGAFTTAVAGGWPAEGQAWRLKDNSWRTLSAANVLAVWAAFQTRMAALFGAFATKEAAVIAETDIAVLRAYDVNTGWPA